MFFFAAFGAACHHRGTRAGACLTRSFLPLRFVSVQVDSCTPPAARAFVDRHVRPEGSGFRAAVLTSLATFTAELYAK